MDIEKTIEFILEQQAQVGVRLQTVTEQQARFVAQLNHVDQQIQALSNSLLESGFGLGLLW